MEGIGRQSKEVWVRMSRPGSLEPVKRMPMLSTRIFRGSCACGGVPRPKVFTWLRGSGCERLPSVVIAQAPPAAREGRWRGDDGGGGEPGARVAKKGQGQARIRRRDWAALSSFPAGPSSGNATLLLCASANVCLANVCEKCENVRGCRTEEAAAAAVTAAGCSRLELFDYDCSDR